MSCLGWLAGLWLADLDASVLFLLSAGSALVQQRAMQACLLACCTHQQEWTRRRSCTVQPSGFSFETWVGGIQQRFFTRKKSPVVYTAAPPLLAYLSLLLANPLHGRRLVSRGAFYHLLFFAILGSSFFLIYFIDLILYFLTSGLFCPSLGRDFGSDSIILLNYTFPPPPSSPG